jgi:hypothetical protein
MRVNPTLVSSIQYQAKILNLSMERRKYVEELKDLQKIRHEKLSQIVELGI